MSAFLLVMCVLCSYLIGTDQNMDFRARTFEGVERVRELECSFSGEVVSINIVDIKDNSSLTSLSSTRTGDKCNGGAVFSSCSFSAPSEPLSATARALITDLSEGETRNYLCSVDYMNDEKNVEKRRELVAITRNHTSTTVVPTTTLESAEKENAESSVATASPMFSNSVVIVLLVVLAIVVTAAIVAGLIYCKRRNRKRRPRDLDALSMRSGMTSRSFYEMGAKGPQRFSFDDGQGMQTMTRQLSYSLSAPPSSLAPEVPGYKGGRVMQYQKPTDCMPGSATMPPVSEAAFPAPQLMMSQYQEPWGRTLEDPEILGRLTSLRSNRGAVVKIPDFDAASHPAPPSSPPTQETSRALMEERE